MPPRIPESTEDIVEYLLENVLEDDLDPGQANAVMNYVRSTKSNIYGIQQTYFVLGSYEPPFRYRLNKVVDWLNNRPLAYAFVQATQSEVPLPDDEFATLKIKFFTLALAADRIVLILEHNHGGAVGELTRIANSSLINRTHLLPRTAPNGFDPGEIPSDEFDTRDDVFIAGVGAVYTAESEAELQVQLESIVTAATEAGIDIEQDSLERELNDEFAGYQPISYSEVIVDEWTEYRQAGTLQRWTTVGDLESEIRNL